MFIQTLFDRIAALEAALGNKSCALSDLTVVQLAAPTGLAITQGGAVGTTSYSYNVADIGNGDTASPATVVQTTTGNATLSTTNFNIITFVTIPGHRYKVWRTASSGTPSTTGKIADFIADDVTATINDTGLTAYSSVIATTNTTGAVCPAGPVFAGAQVLPTGTPVAENTVGAATLTVAAILSGFIVRGGTQSGGFSDTTPTAAALVAALKGVQIGNYIDLLIRNTTGQTETVLAGTGVTLATGNTNTIATVNTRRFRIVFTGVLSGSEAVTVYSVGAGAH